MTAAHSGSGLIDCQGIGDHTARDATTIGTLEVRYRRHIDAASAQVTDCLPVSAWASVPPSTYSSSPPIGTPCAIRLARMLRRVANSPRKWAVASPSTVGF